MREKRKLDMVIRFDGTHLKGDLGQMNGIGNESALSEYTHYCRKIITRQNCAIEER